MGSVCYTCGGKGHLSRECPSGRVEPRPPPASTPASHSLLVALPQPYGSGKSLDYWLSAVEANITADFPRAIELCRSLFKHMRSNPEEWNVKQLGNLRAYRRQIKKSDLYSGSHDPESSSQRDESSSGEDF